jgi:hypothetical protein
MIRVRAVTRQENDGLLALLNYLAEGDRQHLSLPRSTNRVPKDTPPTQAGLSLLAGPPFVLDLGTTLAGRAILSGRTVLYVDGANAFDPYILSALARDAGQPPKVVMQRLHLSRAFTCHQLETLIVERLPSAIVHYRPDLVVISGWSHLFHDENVPAREAFRLLQNTARRIRSLTEAGQPILATHPEEPVTPRLQPLGEILTRAADGVARLREEEGLILVAREKPPDPHGDPAHTAGIRPGALGARSLVISQEHCRPWIRGRRHQELPVAYPWSGR